VRLTGKHLRNTGQYTGSAGLDRWIVTHIEQGTDGWVIATTDEPRPDAAQIWTPEELEQYPQLRFRRINVANLEIVK
jgi:hypothetical protein